MLDCLVIFDCDGVLVDTETMLKRVAKEIASELGIVLTDEDHERYVGVLDVDMLADWANRFAVVIPDDSFERLQSAKLAASSSDAIAPSLAHA